MSVKIAKFYNYNLKYDIQSAMSNFQTIHQILEIPLDIPKFAAHRLEFEELFKIKFARLTNPSSEFLKIANFQI